jgi:hypothetical protein
LHSLDPINLITLFALDSVRNLGYDILNHLWVHVDTRASVIQSLLKGIPSDHRKDNVLCTLRVGEVRLS